jgi:hypothetical protein
MAKSEFIPATTARAIGSGVFFRPVKSWHSGTYSGEKLEHMPGSNDRSGCLYDVKVGGALRTCSPPLTVTHRLYWHERDPSKTISVFLSYPDGMGCSDGKYFWESYGLDQHQGDIERYFGESAETEMEADVIQHFANVTVSA